MHIACNYCGEFLCPLRSQCTAMLGPCTWNFVPLVYACTVAQKTAITVVLTEMSPYRNSEQLTLECVVNKMQALESWIHNKCGRFWTRCYPGSRPLKRTRESERSF